MFINPRLILLIAHGLCAFSQACKQAKYDGKRCSRLEWFRVRAQLRPYWQSPKQWTDYAISNWLVVWLPFFIFPYIGLLIIPIDFHIFQRGGPTTNQVMMCIKSAPSKMDPKRSISPLHELDNRYTPSRLNNKTLYGNPKWINRYVATQNHLEHL